MQLSSYIDFSCETLIKINHTLNMFIVLKSSYLEHEKNVPMHL